MLQPDDSCYATQVFMAQWNTFKPKKNSMILQTNSTMVHIVKDSEPGNSPRILYMKKSLIPQVGSCYA